MSLKRFCCFNFEKEILENKIKILEITVAEQKKEIEGYKLSKKLEETSMIDEIGENEIVVNEITLETN